MKIRPDKFFLLNYPDAQSKENLKQKIVHKGSRVQYKDAAELDKIARNAVTQYRVEISGVKQQFKGDIVEIDGKMGKKKIVEEMARLMHLKESKAPKKAPRIIIMGPPGVELEAHAINLSQKYRLVYIDIDQLVKDYIRRGGEEAAELRVMFKNGEPLPDGTSIRLLKDRLEMADCKTNGWILKGAPTSMDQMALLKELYQQPSLILSLDMSDNLIYEKLEQRRFDPVTNKYHYVLNENIKDEAILGRLIHKFEDQHRYIKKQLYEYRTFMQSMTVEYSHQLISINAE